MQQKYTNRLAGSLSPYLLQHAHNPVDWYPWSEEAFAKAKAEDKPIFLSIGYSACHWCHVMERESFENVEIAQFLNQHFVSIKVDREERPDIDDVYMTAVIGLTGQGGWPLTVFLTPDGKPFFGGTYFPPVDYYWRPGFLTILKHVAAFWRERREEIEQAGADLSAFVQAQHERVRLNVQLSANELRAISMLPAQQYDREHGGWGHAPKFPPHGLLLFLLRQAKLFRDVQAREMALTTLDAMARGGIYDHVGGGFCRYAVDREWKVPHFEKMLYDNAQLAQEYLEAYQLTQNIEYRRIAEQTLEYLLRDMRAESGGFYASEDADSEGEEGNFYLWMMDELRAVLGDEATLFCEVYGAREGGNFSSHESYHIKKNILYQPEPIHTTAARLGIELAALRERLDSCLAIWREMREKRQRPARDEKIITAWNGLALSALAVAAQALGSAQYAKAAVVSGEFMWRCLCHGGEYVVHSVFHNADGGPGFLEDYAATALGFLDLYEATGDFVWLKRSRTLADSLIARFWNPAVGLFSHREAGRDNRLPATYPTSDSAEPSGNALGALLLLRLSRFFDDAVYRKRSESVATKIAAEAKRAPHGYAYSLLLWQALHFPGPEWVLVGNLEEEAAMAAAELLRKTYVPYRTLVIADLSRRGDDLPTDSLPEMLPLLQGRLQASPPFTVYLCENSVCEQPIRDLATLQQALQRYAES